MWPGSEWCGRVGVLVGVDCSSSWGVFDVHQVNVDTQCHPGLYRARDGSRMAGMVCGNRNPLGGKECRLG